MNRDKLVSLFVFAAIGALTFAAYADTRETPAQVLPTVAAVLPDPLPLDMTHAPSVRRPEIQTTAEVTIYGTTPEKPAPKGKTWVCSEPRALATDSSATVRECNWI